MLDLQVVWAYVDPVTILPVTSIIATLVGVIMLCGRSIQRAVVRWARLGRSGGTGLQGAHLRSSTVGTARAKPLRRGPADSDTDRFPKAPSDRSDRRLS